MLSKEQFQARMASINAMKEMNAIRLAAILATKGIAEETPSQAA